MGSCEHGASTNLHITVLTSTLYRPTWDSASGREQFGVRTFQEAPALEAKLVRCIRGSIFDVVLDLRPESATYGKWYGAELSAKNGRTLYLPEHCVHGYQTLEEETEMYYLASQFYTPSAVRGVRYDDRAFNIRWPLTAIVVSEQDRNQPCYRSSI